MKRIDSRANPLFQDLRDLARDHRRQRRERRTILEGIHLVEAALAHGRRPELVVVAAEALEKAEVRVLLSHLAGCEVVVMAENLVAAIGELASAAPVLARIAIPEAPSIWPEGDCLLLEGVQDAVNVGAMLRVAAAAGVRDVLTTPGSAGVWSARALRAGQGAQFALAIREHVDALAFLSQCRNQTIAAVAHGGRSLYAFDLLPPTVWVMGSEGAGICGEVLARVGQQATIPIAAGAESLNVATAAAVCLFEMRRQRLAMMGS